MTFNNNKIGLVFSGGGGKGAYEIGVWRALQEFNLCHQISAIAGASVGALNAALFAQGDLALAEKLWQNMEQGDVLYSAPISMLEKIGRLIIAMPGGTPAMAVSVVRMLRSKGTFSRAGLLSLMEKNIDASKVASLGLPVFATCRKKGSLKIRHFSLANADPSRLFSILLASSAIPFIFPPETIDGEQWFDGGIPSIKGSNTPIQAVYDAGCRFIIAVLLDMDDLVDVTQFPDAKILFVYPQESNGGFFSGALDFEGIHADRRMEQGYEDTMRILEPIFRMGVAQIRYEKILEIALQQAKEFAQLTRNLEEAKIESSDAKAEAIRAIAELHENCSLTDQEFSNAKKRIIERL